MANARAVHISKPLERRIADEFRKSLFSDWEPRFFTILILCILLEAVIVFFLAQRPVPEYSQKEIEQIQERFASFVLGEDVSGRREGVVASTIPGTVTGAVEGTGADGVGGDGEGEGEGDGAGGGSGGGEGQGEGTGTGDGIGPGEGGVGSGVGDARRFSRMEAAEARRRTREAISRQVSNKGILGLLTGTGRAAGGKAVSGLVVGSGGGSGGNEDLDRVLSSVNGLKTQGIPGGGGSGSGPVGGSGSGDGSGGVRGGRSGGKATIDDLVSDISSSSESQTLTRKGELSIEAPTEVVGRGRKSIYRSPDAIQEVLISHNAAIRYCYERELKRNPTLKGKITVRITIGPEGAVTNAEIVSSTLNSERVERCILARIRLWNDFQPIEEAEGEVTFRQVYTFGY
jgi:TonB family protein